MARSPWTTIGAVLLALAAASQLAYGVGAVVQIDAFADNVETIENNPNFGKLYLSLPAWGVLLLLAGTGELLAALRLARGKGRNAGLAALLPGLVVGFFTLALLREAALVSLFLLLSALYVLSYRVPER